MNSGYISAGTQRRLGHYGAKACDGAAHGTPDGSGEAQSPRRGEGNARIFRKAYPLRCVQPTRMQVSGCKHIRTVHQHEVYPISILACSNMNICLRCDSTSHRIWSPLLAFQPCENYCLLMRISQICLTSESYL